MVERDDHGLAMTALSTGEALVATTLRLWAEQHEQGAGFATEWADGLAAAGCDGADTAEFDLLATATVGGARGRFQMHRPCCGGLGRDEARLLQMLALLQHGRRAGAAALLEGWLTPAATRMVLYSGPRIALRLGDLGLHLPVRLAGGIPLPAARSAHPPGPHRLQ